MGRRNSRNFWWAFGIGVAPDIFSFGIFSGMAVLGLASNPGWSAGPPPASLIPPYVHLLYNITHSLIIFALVFFVVWFLRQKPFLPLLAWGIHILMDIPTHSTEFFPTPFLWPFFNNIRFDGIPWSNPVIFIPNVVLLVVLYIYFFGIKKYWRSKKKTGLN